MKNYSDKELQNHELNFWINGYNPPFFHYDYYSAFFPFSELKEKKVLDIGCGGAPISDYCGVEIKNLTLIDPLLDELKKNNKYHHLNKYECFSGSLFEFDKCCYEYVICLNVVDHFNDNEYNFINKFYEMLDTNGYLWLYYDLRHENDGDHLKIDNNKLINKLKTFFDIIKIDETVNPKHENWSSVYSSIRIIAKKNGKNN